MLKLLDSEADLDFLAAEDAYDADIGNQYRTVRYQGLQGYRQDLIADFNALYTVAAPIAVSHPELAELLYATCKTLKRSIRYISFRMWLELVLPTPSPAKGPSPLRRLLDQGPTDYDAPVPGVWVKSACRHWCFPDRAVQARPLESRLTGDH